MKLPPHILRRAIFHDRGTSPPGDVQAPRPRSPSDAEVIAAYEQTGSVWRAGELLGIPGQRVHSRLSAIGVCRRMRILTENEKQLIRACYSEGFTSGDGKLDALSRQIGRTRQFICRFAKSEGLTSQRRQHSESFKAKQADAKREQWKNHPHPRGALGMKHSASTKMMLSWKSRAAWDARTEDERVAMTRKQLQSRLEKYGTLAKPRQKTTWKQGWRTVGDQRIYCRSRWENNYAVFLQFLLDHAEIAKWEHEPETFWFDGVKRGCVSYLPDFRVTYPDGSVEYHEVKGWMDQKSRTKLRRMKKYHPAVVLRVIDGRWFKQNAPKLSFLPGWEHGGRSTR